MIRVLRILTVQQIIIQRAREAVAMQFRGERPPPPPIPPPGCPSSSSTVSSSVIHQALLRNQHCFSLLTCES